MTESENIKAVLFDLDGTLIDTEKYYRICWPKAMKMFGYNMTDEQTLTLRSLGRPFAPEHLKKMMGDPNLDYYAIRAKRSELMEQLIAENGIQLKPGAVELLTYLRSKGIITAITTATDLERTERYLKMTGISELFDRKISAAMVSRGKPAPDVYTYAVNALGLSAGECAAVEDSPNGVKSASSAGLKVIMVPDQDEPDESITRLLWKKVRILSDIAEFI